MPSVLLLVIGGTLLWIAVSVLAVALCRVAGEHQYAAAGGQHCRDGRAEGLEVACQRPARDVLVVEADHRAKGAFLQMF